MGPTQKAVYFGFVFLAVMIGFQVYSRRSPRPKPEAAITAPPPEPDKRLFEVTFSNSGVEPPEDFVVLCSDASVAIEYARLFTKPGRIGFLVSSVRECAPGFIASLRSVHKRDFESPFPRREPTAVDPDECEGGP